METDLKRLTNVGRKAMVVALFGVLFPFGGGMLASLYLFGFPMDVALFVSGTLTATSIGITLRVLKDIDRQQTGIAQIVIGAAIIDDVIGIILLVFIYDFSISREFTFTNTFSVAALVITFLILAPVAAKLFATLMRKFHGKERVPGFIPTIIISLILFFAYLSHSFGAPEILGSFAAGLALSRRFFLPFGAGIHTDEKFSRKVEESMTPIIQIFTPIFFVMVGLSMDLSVIDFGSGSFWLMGIAFTLIAVLGKYLGAFMITQGCRTNNMLIGISMIPRGEVGLIFAEMGRVGGILPNDVYAMLIFVIVITTIVPPFLLKWLFRYECA
jgi:Kef-type K+ transport system membrane component KefB